MENKDKKIILSFKLILITYLNSNLLHSSTSVVVITTAQLHSTRPDLRFCTGSNPAHGISEICDGEDL